MYCRHCGAHVEDGHIYCPSCGQKADGTLERKGLPFWLKSLFFLLVAGSLFAIFAYLSEDDPKDTITDELVKLKNHELTEAYYNFTSLEYQKTTSLSQFKDTLKSFPPLSEVESIETLEKTVDEKSARYIIDAKAKTSSFKMEWDLIKEDGRWKILDFKVLNTTEAEAKNNPIEPIQHTLKYLKQGDIKEAYNDLATTEFKEATSLKEFEDFVHGNPILQLYKSFEKGTTSDYSGIKKITMKLVGDGEPTIVEFTLSIENGIWKVRGMQVGASEAETTPLAPAVSFDSSELTKTVSEFLELVKQGSLEKAYNTLTSESFKKVTAEDKFIEVITKYPAFTKNSKITLSSLMMNNNVATYKALLDSSDGESKQVQFDLIPEDAEWKIQQILIFKDPGETGSLSFVKVEVSDQSNPNGSAKNPRNPLPAFKTDLYVNLFIDHVKKGDKITLTLVNEDQSLSSPPIEHTIEQDAESYTAFFVYNPPEGGWPLGRYSLKAGGPENITRTFNFEIH